MFVNCESCESKIEGPKTQISQRKIAYHGNKSTADQLAIQIRKLALCLEVIYLHKYLWLKKLALFDMFYTFSICLICFDSKAIYSSRYLLPKIMETNKNLPESQ